MISSINKHPKSHAQSTIAGFDQSFVRSAFRSRILNVRTSESGGAVFDKTGSYRYLLWRNFSESSPGARFATSRTHAKSESETLLLVMLNPNKADENHNDPTIRRCIGFARSWGFNRLEVVNLFAICAEKPRMLRDFKKPIGFHNDEIILERASLASALVVAWGTHGAILGRDADVLSKLESFGPLKCFGITKDGMPRHPLYVRGDIEPLVFRA